MSYDWKKESPIVFYKQMKKILTCLFVLFFSSILYGEKGQLILDGERGGFTKGYWDSDSFPPEGFFKDSRNVFVHNRKVEPIHGYGKVSTNTIALGYDNEFLWTYEKDDGTKYHLVRGSNTVWSRYTGGDYNVEVATFNVNYSIDAVNYDGYVYIVGPNDDAVHWDGTTATRASAIPHGRFIEIYKNHMFIAGRTGARNILEYSAQGDTSTWSTSRQEIIGTEGDVITGLFRSGDILYITTRYSIWGLQGNSMWDFQLFCVNSDKGMLFKTAQAYYQGYPAFLSNDGVYALSNELVELSGAIRDTIDDIEQMTPNKAFWLQSTAEDFNYGTIGMVDTTTVSNSIILDKVDTASDWNEGTCVRIDSTTSNGNIYIDIEDEAVKESQTTSTGYQTFSMNEEKGQTFYTDNNEKIVITKLVAYINTSATSGNITYRIRDGSMGTILATKSGTYSSPSGSPQWFYLTLDSSLSITDYTTYTFTIEGTSGDWRWYINSNNNSYTKGSLYGDTVDTVFRIYGKLRDGYYTSKIYDYEAVPNSTTWCKYGNFTSSHTTNGQTLAYFVRNSTDSVLGDSPSWSSITNLASIDDVLTTRKRYFQWKSSFTTTNSTTTPVIHQVYVGGYYTSPQKDVGLDWKSWWLFAPTVQYYNASSSCTYYIKASGTSAGLTNSSYTAITANTEIKLTTGTYIQWQVYLNTIDPNPTNELQFNDATVNWYESEYFQNPYMVDWDNKLWLSCAISSTSNNTILVLDENGAWTRHDISALAMGVYKDGLFFTDSSTSTPYVYKFTPDEYKFDGEAIDSYIELSDYNLGGDRDVLLDYWTLLSLETSDSDTELKYALDKGTYYPTAQTITLDLNEKDNFYSDYANFPSSFTLCRYFRPCLSANCTNHWSIDALGIYFEVLRPKGRR